MPKKRDGTESKKRKSSSASKDVSSSPTIDILPPPTPSATHLVASNPFDDTAPSNPMKMVHNFPSQSMMRMGGNMGPGMPGWAPNPRSGIRTPYGNHGGPGWNPAIHGNPNIRSIPNFNPAMPNNGFNHYTNPGMPPFRGPPRMPMNNMRPGMGHLGPSDYDGLMHEPSMGPNHLVSSGNQGHMLQNTGQMKALTRSNVQMPSPNVRKGSSSSNKNLTGDTKSPKAADTVPIKQRKKSEKKSAEKSKNSNSEKGNNVDPPVPPHSTPPKEPQSCKMCSRVIDHLNEDAIRCIASCNVWYHRACVGITPEAYNLLKNEEFAVWACDSCLHAREIPSVFTRPLLSEGQVAFG